MIFGIIPFLYTFGYFRRRKYRRVFFKSRQWLTLCDKITGDFTLLVHIFPVTCYRFIPL